MGALRSPLHRPARLPVLHGQADDGRGGQERVGTDGSSFYADGADHHTMLLTALNGWRVQWRSLWAVAI